jgi:hypothetical protein
VGWLTYQFNNFPLLYYIDLLIYPLVHWTLVALKLLQVKSCTALVLPLLTAGCTLQALSRFGWSRAVVMRFISDKRELTQPQIIQNTALSD